MKRFLLFVLLISLLEQGFAQNNDSLKHWSMGACASLYFLRYPQYPDFPNNGLPQYDDDGDELKSSNGGVGSSIGLLALYRINKKICFQTGILKSSQNQGFRGIGIERILMTYGPGYFNFNNGININIYHLKYLEFPLLFKYYYKIKRKRNAYFSLGIVPGFLSYEKIIKEDSTYIWQTFVNNKFRFNRVRPMASIGCDYFLGKTTSLFWECSFEYRPIYLRNNAYVKTTTVDFRYCSGINFHF
jgi:hypothetical protein